MKKQRWVYGASFPVNGSPDSSVETQAIQETNHTWTAQVAQRTHGVTVKSTLFGGFGSLFEALRTANAIGLAIATGKRPGKTQRKAPPSS
jgi:hypothetical protein